MGVGGSGGSDFNMSYTHIRVNHIDDMSTVIPIECIGTWAATDMPDLNETT